MVNYQYGKIYKIEGSGMVYIGSTTLPLVRRFQFHRSAGNRTNSKKIIEAGECSIVLIEDWPCSSKQELVKREREHIQATVCVNLMGTFVGDKQAYNKWYAEQHKERLIEYRKNRYAEHSEDLRQKAVEYYHSDQEASLERARKYREANREILRMKAVEYRAKKKSSV